MSILEVSLPIRNEFFRHFPSYMTDPDICWTWLGSFNSNGYGRLWISGQMYYAHRISYAIHHGNNRIDSEIMILHKCVGGGNPGCVNPHHLKIGSFAENMRDCILAGLANTPKGESHGNTVYPYTTIEEIRRLASNGLTVVEISRLLSIPHSTISRTIAGKARK